MSAKFYSPKDAARRLGVDVEFLQDEKVLETLGLRRAERISRHGNRVWLLIRQDVDALVKEGRANR